MSLGYDPNVPAGFQDADIEMAEMAARASERYDCRYACGFVGTIEELDAHEAVEHTS